MTIASKAVVKYVRRRALERPRTVAWIFALLAGFVLLFLLFRSDWFQNLMDGAIGWAKDIMESHPVGGALVFVIFSALSAMLAFASSTVLVPPANLVWGKTITFFLLWGGWTIGAVAAFGIGKLAQPLLYKMGYKKKLEKYRQFVSSHMRFWAVLLRPDFFFVPSRSKRKAGSADKYGRPYFKS